QGTQVKLLLHERLFTRILENSDGLIRNTEWFKQFVSYRNQQEVVDAEAAKADLLDHLDVRAEANSRLISVRMSWSVPKDCQTIVTEIVNQHIKDQTEAHNTADSERTNAIERLKVNYESEIRDISNRTLRIAQDLGTRGAGVGPGANSKEFE